MLSKDGNMTTQYNTWLLLHLQRFQQVTEGITHMQCQSSFSPFKLGLNAIRSTTGGGVFTGVCLSTGEGGSPCHWSCPKSCPNQGYPLILSLVLSRGIPSPVTGPFLSPVQGWDRTRVPGYSTGSTPLVVTQEDFLVYLII